MIVYCYCYCELFLQYYCVVNRDHNAKQALPQSYSKIILREPLEPCLFSLEGKYRLEQLHNKD